MPKQDKEKGISLRTIHLWLIIGAVIISGLMILFTFQLTTSFHALTHVSEQQVELAQAARELMDASDYLTEKVQRLHQEAGIFNINELIQRDAYFFRRQTFCIDE